MDNNLDIGEYLTDEIGGYYLILGDTIHRPHLYKIIQAPAKLSPITIHQKQTPVSGETMALIHHLTYEYYTTYTNIIKLFFPADIAKLFQKQPNPLKSTKKQSQHLIIMPDWRTITHKQSEYHYELNQAIGSQHTINQDIKLFWDIAHGLTDTIVCTPGECFWDYHNLGQITLIDPHKRYYKSQQDPRYDIMRVCELMSHYHKASLVTNII